MIPHPAGRVAMLVLGIVALLSPILGMLLGDYMPQEMASFLHRAGSSWIILFVYLLLVIALIDLVRLTHLLPVERIFEGNWTGIVALASLLVVCFTLGHLNYRNKRKVELSLTVNKKPEGGVKSLKIVAISDLHLGYGIGRKEFESWLPLLNDEDPDVVLIVGDLVDSQVHPLFAGNFAESIRKIRARYGVYAVLGNHEYIGNATKSAEFLHLAGVTLLKDSTALIGDAFYLIGRDDCSNPWRKSIEDLIAPLDRNKPLILLDHQPVDLAGTVRNHIDLQLSGHTHKGQVWPLSWIVNGLFEHAYGYQKKEDSHIYVTSGLGIWGGKFRIGSQSEYVVIHLALAGED
jgi:predicted MPP superfamily phosphohydrolase